MNEAVERSPEENAASVNLLMLDKEVDKKVGQAIIKLLSSHAHTDSYVDNELETFNDAMDADDQWTQENVLQRCIAESIARQISPYLSSTILGMAIQSAIREEIKDVVSKIQATL